MCDACVYEHGHVMLLKLRPVSTHAFGFIYDVLTLVVDEPTALTFGKLPNPKVLGKIQSSITETLPTVE